MRRITVIIVLMAAVLFFTVSAYSLDTPGEIENEPVRHVIIDSDTAGDDSLAIILAVKSGALSIEGITVAGGNVSLDQAGRNALQVVEQVGADIPVYLGGDHPLVGKAPETFSVYGLDGMGDMDLIHPVGEVSDKNALDFILETVKKYPDEIEIIGLGPMSNIAHAIINDPETMKHVKRIWSMGSQGLGPGNATPLAEFNVYKDAAAYNLVLQSGIPMTIIGLDMCDAKETLISADLLAKLGEGNELEQFVSKSFAGLLDFRRKTQNVNNVDAPDAVAMMHVIRPDEFTVSTAGCYAYAVSTPGDFLGTVMFYRDDVSYDGITPEKKNEMLENGNVTLVLAQDRDYFIPTVFELLEK